MAIIVKNFVSTNREIVSIRIGLQSETPYKSIVSLTN